MKFIISLCTFQVPQLKTLGNRDTAFAIEIYIIVICSSDQGVARQTSDFSLKTSDVDHVNLSLASFV